MLLDTVSSYSEVAEAVREAGARSAKVRIRGGGTKIGWGRPGAAGSTDLSTLGLDKILEHNAGDLTAVVQAGVRLDEAQRLFAEAGQMLALDPPLGEGGRTTIGGVVATADSGPLRHGYGGVRDQVIGIRVALADGTVARSGGKVIKNVAGYDLGKLFTGSFGTLGVILEVAFRLHPLPGRSLTAAGETDDHRALRKAAVSLSNSPVRATSLDFSWEAGRGKLLARFMGGAAGAQAERGTQIMEAEGLAAGVEEDDEVLWADQRGAQRSEAGVVFKISALPTELDRVIEMADILRARAAGRAGLGISWLRLDPGRTISEISNGLEQLRTALSPRPVVVQDAPEEARQTLDVWGSQQPGVLAIMRRLKDRFDALGVCNQGIFVGDI